MDRDNLWKKQISEKSGKIYFVNTITDEVFETSTSIHEKDSYIKIQTIDGQVQIPEDALVVLIQWSSIFDVFSRWKKDSIPNVNVSSSYLTRLISIASVSFQYDSLDLPSFELDDNSKPLHTIDDPPLLKFQMRKQIYYMFNLHTKDKFTEFYDKEIGITDQMKEFFNELTGYNCFCENILYVIRNNYENYHIPSRSFSINVTKFPRDKLDELYSMFRWKYAMERDLNDLKTIEHEDVSDIEARVKYRWERMTSRGLKSLWKNLDENERLEWCLHEMVNAGLDIN